MTFHELNLLAKFFQERDPSSATIISEDDEDFYAGSITIRRAITEEDLEAFRRWRAPWDRREPLQGPVQQVPTTCPHRRLTSPWWDDERDPGCGGIFLVCDDCGMERVRLHLEEILTRPAPMDWTTEPPDLPGVYWWRDRDGGVGLVELFDETVGRQYPMSMTAQRLQDIRWVGGHWAGPIDPPPAPDRQEPR